WRPALRDHGLHGLRRGRRAGAAADAGRHAQLAGRGARRLVTDEASGPRRRNAPGPARATEDRQRTSTVTLGMITGSGGGRSPGSATASMALSVSRPSSTWPNTV